MTIHIKTCALIVYISCLSGLLLADISPLEQTCSQSDSLALVEFYTTSNGVNWSESWDFNQPISSWYGVTVNSNGCVISLDLRYVVDGPISYAIGALTNLEEIYFSGGNLLSGLPPEISQLQSLKVLYAHEIPGPFQSSITDLINLERLSITFKDNNNTSAIPNSISNLTSLKDLSIVNGINGAFPSSIGQLSQLEKLNFQTCFFSGSIPNEIGQLQNLRELVLINTSISGSIPNSISNLTAIKKIIIAGNEISGSIPSTLGNLQNLKSLNLNANNLTGSIPPELGQLTNLTTLSLKQNQFANSIPEELENLSNLSYLNLSSNQLSGSIPPTLGNLLKLSVFDLSYNSLTGQLPEELGNLIELNKLRIQNNPLSGSIPHTFSNLYGIEKLYLGNNNLSGCYDASLAAFCDGDALLILNKGNNFDESFSEYCATQVGECPCSYNRTLSNQIDPGSYKAINTITSDGSVPTSANVQFQAGKSIQLNPEFLTQPNGEFEALIDNCNE